MFARTQRTTRLRLSPIIGFLSLVLLAGGVEVRTPNYSLGVSQSHADDVPDVAPLRPVAAIEAAEPSLEIVLPKRTTAGLLAEIHVKTTGINDQATLKWKLPHAEYQDGESKVTFAEVANLSSRGRTLRFAWPAAGPLAFSVRALIPISDKTTGELIDINEVESTFTFTQTGGSIGPEPAVTIPKPTAPLDSAVAGVTAKLAGKPVVAQDLSRFFLAVATNIDRGACSSTGAVRQLLVKAGGLAFYGQLLAQTPGMGDEVNSVLATQLGLDEAALDPTKRAQCVGVFKAIAWACAEAK